MALKVCRRAPLAHDLASLPGDKLHAETARFAQGVAAKAGGDAAGYFRAKAAVVAATPPAKFDLIGVLMASWRSRGLAEPEYDAK